MAFRAWNTAESFNERTGEGFWGGIPNLDTWGQDIFGGIWGAINPFPFDPRDVAPAPRLPAVISELPTVPEGWETVIIGGVERIRVPDVYNPPDARPGVFEPFDPGVVIGQVGGPDTAAQDDVGETEVAHDWGHMARQFIGSLGSDLLGINNPAMSPINEMGGPGSTQQQLATIAATGGANGDCDGMTWGGGAPPKGYKVVRDSCGNGVLRKVRRRRRRRMLTSGDKDDIASIVSMVGKGQMAAALINGSMRRG